MTHSGEGNIHEVIEWEYHSTFIYDDPFKILYKSPFKLIEDIFSIIKA